jgi:hypothetical protein
MLPRWWSTAVMIVAAANVAGIIWVLWLILLLGGCSTTAERFDQRPPLCRDLGKRGAEC